MRASGYWFLLCVLLTVLCLVIISTGAYAQMIYATGNDGTSLITIDTGTGDGTVIGSTGTTGTFAAAFSPDGTLYTVTNARSDGSSSYLGTFDLLTGTVTTIGGPLNIGYMTSLEFAPDGTLYGGAFTGPGDIEPNNSYLYTIDTTTGAASQIGEIGLDAVMDFAFDSSGTLWAVNGGPVSVSDLYTVDLDTGSGTYVSTISGTTSDDYIMGIMFDSSDTLYATTFWEPPDGGTSHLYTINPLSGAALSSVGNTGISLAHGGDILVPEPISSILFLTGGATLGFRCFRNKFKK